MQARPRPLSFNLRKPKAWREEAKPPAMERAQAQMADKKSSFQKEVEDLRIKLAENDSIGKRE